MLCLMVNSRNSLLQCPRPSLLRLYTYSLRPTSRSRTKKSSDQCIRVLSNISNSSQNRRSLMTLSISSLPSSQYGMRQDILSGLLSTPISSIVLGLSATQRWRIMSGIP
ncbi:uncharacterized protein BDV14DRAFT_166889 [Aspergillus stella-maris]|uniref:uncharacterized protein n=1 Tax=Aspergillus stella-maris TaxID=1810926 RepID=UPI003CCCB643